MSDDVESVRNAVDIVELVGERVKLTRAGQDWKGLCPFHTEKTPSFFVRPSTQTYNCFGCGEKGSCFDWLMKMDRLEFRDALYMLAERAGIQLTGRSAGRDTINEAQTELMASALAFFQTSLERSEPAQAYVRKRGFNDDVLKLWEIGYAPDVDSALASYLQRNKMSLADASRVGLLSGSEQEGYRDFLVDRLVFPIRDERSRIVGFGGRSLGSREPKYVNSRESKIFEKRGTLYGLYRAKERLKGDARLILAEGYTDVIACHRAGVETAVATLGTSLTEKHARLIHRWTSMVTLLYDSDSAGRKAALRSFDILRAADLDVRAVLLPKGEDPDTILETNGPQGLRDYVQTAISPIQFQVESLKLDGLSEEEFWKAAKRAIASSPDLLDADRVVDDLASIHPNSSFSRTQALQGLKQEIQAMRKRPRRAATAPDTVLADGKRVPPAEALVLRAALNPEHRGAVLKLIEESGNFHDPDARDLAAALVHAFADKPSIEISDLIHSLPEKERSVALSLEPQPDPYRNTTEPITEEGVLGAVEMLQARHKRERSQDAWQESDKADADFEEAIRGLREKTAGGRSE